LTTDDGKSVPWPRDPEEDVGVRGTAIRRTSLYASDAEDAQIIGWLEPGARVSIVGADARLELVLHAWKATDTRERLHAWIDPKDVSDGAPTPHPLLDAAIPGQRILAEGQYLKSEADGKAFAYSFCSPVHVVEDRGGHVLVAQEDDGIVVQALIERRSLEYVASCPGPLLVEVGVRIEWASNGQRGVQEPTRRLVRHGHSRLYTEGGIPAGLVGAGPYEGPNLKELVEKRASIYWLDAARGRASCEPWRLEPRKDGADLVSRARDASGDTAVTRFAFEATGELDSASIVLLGPESTVVPAPGRTPRLGGVSMACGASYRVVGSLGGVLIVLPTSESAGQRIVGYVQRDAERWYTTRDRCQVDAQPLHGGDERTALAFALHKGC
jgi:hypothetical protein